MLPKPFHSDRNKKEYMPKVSDPATDKIWNSVQKISTVKGSHEMAPKNKN